MPRSSIDNGRYIYIYGKRVLLRDSFIVALSHQHKTRTEQMKKVTWASMRREAEVCCSHVRMGGMKGFDGGDATISRFCAIF